MVTNGEGDEAGGMEEGSLSFSIVPIERREIQVRESLSVGKGEAGLQTR